MSYKNEIDDFIKNGYKSDKIITVLSSTPNILIQNGFPDNPITISPTVLKKILMAEKDTSHGHSLSPDIVKDIPNQLSEPIYIIKGKQGKKIIVTEHVVNTMPVIAVIEIDRNQGRINVNSIRSLYEKNMEIFEQWIKDKVS